MRFLALSALALTTSLSAHADPVADLKTALAGLSGQGTVHTQAAFTFSSKNGNDKNSVPAETTIKVAAEDGPDGLRVTWSHDLLQAVDERSVLTAEQQVVVQSYGTVGRNMRRNLLAIDREIVAQAVPELSFDARVKLICESFYQHN